MAADDAEGTTEEMTAPQQQQQHGTSAVAPPLWSVEQRSSSSIGSLGDRFEAAVTLVAKFGKERITLDDLDASVTVGEVKEMLQEQTRILPKRQKLVGLVALQGGAKGVHDNLPLSGLKVKGGSKKAAPGEATMHQFILMGTPEEEIFVDPSDRDDLPDVLDDFGLEFNAGSSEWSAVVCSSSSSSLFTVRPLIQLPAHTFFLCTPFSSYS